MARPFVSGARGPRVILVALAALLSLTTACSEEEKAGPLNIFGNTDGGKDASNDVAKPDATDDATDDVTDDVEVPDASEDVVEPDAEDGSSEAAPDAEDDVIETDGDSDGSTDAEIEAEAAAPDCTNQMQDGDETDVDCGGSCTLKCETGQGCVVGGDCLYGNCVGDVCVAPTCSDGIQNADETDIDCGTPLCGPCQPGQKCDDAVDCSSGVCDGNECQAATCFDLVKNGNETATDCGGSCATKCAIGQACLSPSDCTSNLCPASSHVCACPAGMANVPVLGGGAYCIDSTEVTWSDYQTFVLANPPTSGQIVGCSWNTTYVPAQLWPPAPGEKRPVTYIDWCDAYAYCTWAGKRLCGQVAGGALDYASYNDPTKSEWFNACSAQAVNDYPYGDTYIADRCVGADYGSAEPVSVGTHVTSQFCVGGVPSLVDMSGNVAEWENSCESQTAGALCRTRGGSFESDATALMCNADAFAARTTAASDIGFRCCL